jgi:hypothetical protein
MLRLFMGDSAPQRWHLMLVGKYAIDPIVLLHRGHLCLVE